MLFRLLFHTENPDGVGDTVNIFLFPGLSLSDGSEAALLVRRWETDLDRGALPTYDNTALLLQHQKVDTIIGWEAAVGRSHHAVYKITILIDM